MAKKNDDGVGIVITFLLFLIIGGYFIIKWAFIGLVIVISAICVWIANLSRKSSKKKAVDSILNECFSDSIIKPVKKVDIKELKETLNIYDISKFDNLFAPQIRDRGFAYYSSKKLKNVRNYDFKWTSDVEGTKVYKTSLEFDPEDENKIIETDCNCPYHFEDNKNCKHIYALLIKAKCEENPLKILNSITDYSNRVTSMVSKETNYIKDNSKNLNLTQMSLSSFSNYIDNFSTQLEKSMKEMEKNKYNEKILLNILIYLIEESYQFNENFKKIIIDTSIKENPVSINKVTNNTPKEDKITLGDALLGVFAVNEIDKMMHKKDDYDEELEKEMDDYMLEDWQKDLVRKGEYEPWNFEEDGELEEDDYYYEDDK